ncbi:hypothetical protein [Desulfotomaculum nigrificans]|uniref:hypothetical protein n=1 Tax=Desulfotomaculum nigrificans TaxID=1565 RepID=UPI0001FAEB19|nr:hypothetical protein [Desulfotomaculum nigrificans]
MGVKILLVNPPVYDYRYTWEKWHQPLSLLKLGTYLRNIGVETRLIDFMSVPPGGKVRKELVNKITVDGFVLRKYRFGLTKTDFYKTLLEYKHSGWVPKEIWFSTLTTYWWPGMVEARDIALKVFPEAKIKIGGLYPTLFPDHAMEKFKANSIVTGIDFHNSFYRGSLSDTTILITGNIPQVCLTRPDYTLLQRPDFAVFQIRCGPSTDEYGGEFFLPGGRNQFRSVSEILNDIVLWNKNGITNFTCYDDKIAADDGGYTFKLLLNEIVENNLKIKIHILNGLYPEDMDEELAQLLKKAGAEKIYFMPSKAVIEDERSRHYHYAAASLKQAGFKLRDLQIGGYFYIGTPGENLREVLKKGLLISHTLGFAIPVFYTPSPWTQDFKELSNSLNVDRLSPHVFPMSELSPLKYKHYDEITRLFAMLNYPFKSQTFDFFGDGKIPSTIKNAIRDLLKIFK